MKKVIAIANQKGGVGKTTTAMNLAVALKKRGKRVLLIDLDPQGNLSEYLGYEDDGKATISELLSQAVSGGTQECDEYVRTSREGVDYLPSNIQLSSADFFLITAMNREQVLRRILEQQAFESYDYVLIDCLPSLGILLINALACCDEVIIPVQTQKFALDGLTQLMKVMQSVKQNINPRLTIGGILLTMLDRTKMSEAVAHALRSQYEELVFDTFISRSIQAADSTYQKISLIEQQGKLGEQYTAFTEELVKRGC